MQNIVFTIGHSTHNLEDFISLLRRYEVTAVCDVRSKPYSGRNPQFNREDLEEALKLNNIVYRFYGDELGGRSNDPACYLKGKVQYEQIAKTEAFRIGLMRIRNGLRDGFHVALMCAERDPLYCHRSILVARHLIPLGVNVAHILGNGQLENHAKAMDRLVRTLNREQEDMFLSHTELLEEAYRRQGERIAYEITDDDQKRRVSE